MRPPEKSPNRRVKAIIELRVVMATQQKVIPAVKTPITNNTLNLVSFLALVIIRSKCLPRPREQSGDLPAEAVRDPAAPHTADEGTRVSNREETVGHGGPHAVLNGKQRNEVEGNEHAAVDEEEG